jgi:starch synthase
MYSQRYGTIPIVRRTGGLADTVTDTIPETIADKTATGIVFDQAESGALLESIKRALILYSNKKIWRQIQVSAMNRDFSWQHSAKQYLTLYQRLIDKKS